MPFTEVFADESSQEALVSTYQAAMEKMVGSRIEVTWKKKSGGKVKTNVILVPVSYGGHLFVLHFVSER